MPRPGTQSVRTAVRTELTGIGLPPTPAWELAPPGFAPLTSAGAHPHPGPPAPTSLHLLRELPAGSRPHSPQAPPPTRTQPCNPSYF